MLTRPGKVASWFLQSPACLSSKTILLSFRSGLSQFSLLLCTQNPWLSSLPACQFTKLSFGEVQITDVTH